MHQAPRPCLFLFFSHAFFHFLFFFPSSRVKQGPSRVRRPAGVADDVALRRRPSSGVASVGRKRAEAGRERALRRDSQQLPPPARVLGGNLSALAFGAGEGLAPREAVQEGFLFSLNCFFASKRAGRPTSLPSSQHIA